MAAPALALETARHGLTLTLAQQRADVAVDEWQEIVTEYGYSYQTAAPAELLDSLIVDVLGIQYAIQSQDNETNLQGLRRAGALLATLMAMTPGPRVNAGTIAVPRRAAGAHCEARASGVNASEPPASDDHRSV